MTYRYFHNGHYWTAKRGDDYVEWIAIGGAFALFFGLILFFPGASLGNRDRTPMVDDGPVTDDVALVAGIVVDDLLD